MTKHPGPWTMRRFEFQADDEAFAICDVDGAEVLSCYQRDGGGDFGLCFESDKARRLILAAPELLAFVLKLRGHDLDMETEGNALNDERDALIARLEKP